jgi:hypothetical protein
MKNLFIGASITLLLISCNIEKRIYMPGYHIISNTDNRNLDKKLAESKVGFRKGQFLMMKKEERLIKTIDTLFVLSDKSMSTLSDANQIIILFFRNQFRNLGLKKKPKRIFLIPILN